MAKKKKKRKKTAKRRAPKRRAPKRSKKKRASKKAPRLAVVVVEEVRPRPARHHRKPSRFAKWAFRRL